MEFIPANESPLFIRVFGMYTRWLFSRRFKKVWIRQEYVPEANSKTVYYLNHHSWWDGLIPLLLNKYRFKQNARAIMEDRQMEKYFFFRKAGAFSVSRDNHRKTIITLRYAVQSMQRDRASLFIYPEGKITPPGSTLTFEGGLAWLHSKIPGADYVPIGIYMHTIRYDKPELYFYVGKPVQTEPDRTNQEKTKLFEQQLERVIQKLRKTAGFDDSMYELFV